MLKKMVWESSFFNVNCAEFYPLHNENELHYDNTIFKNYEWVQGKCSINDEISKSIFTKYSFVFEDTRVTFNKKIEKKEVPIDSRFAISNAQPSDIYQLQQIAIEELVKHSRIPTLVGEKEAGRFYATWVEKAVYGNFDDICFTLKYDNNSIGFITLKYLSEEDPKIGLISIQKSYQKKKLGKALIQYAENFLSDMNCHSIFVTTEGRNIQAQRFYIKYGFNIDYIECWYYYRNHK